MNMEAGQNQEEAPIELIWALARDFIAARDVSFNVNGVIKTA
jgi:hypothetical protein